MINETSLRFKPQYWLYLFILLHVTVWTLAPAWVRFTLPMDAMEGTTWGHQLEWGYDKNPFLNGWLTRLALFAGGSSGWMIYLFSQLSVAVCFWAVWQLGKKMLPPVYALIAVLLLEGMQYYNFHAIDFNDNILELGLWALTTLFFWQALHEKKLSDWILTGLFAGLGMMAKYYTAILLLPMVLFLFANADTRQQFKSPRLYCGLLVFVIVILPHFIWLCSHDFVTMNYVAERVSSPPTWLNHVNFPLMFAWQQFEVFFPALLLFFILLFTGKKSAECPPLSRFDKTFLLYMGTGPLLLTILLSAATGIKLRAAWGQPLLSLWSIMLIAWLRPAVSRKQFYTIVAVIFSLSITMVIAYCTALIRADGQSSANFPGKKIASVLTQQWQNQYHTSLAYVAGPRWLAGDIAFYSKDHPAVFIDWEKKSSPWIDETKLKKQGALFVWDPTEEHQTAVAEIRARFARLGPIQTLHFAWMRNKNMPPIKITVAFLPPQDYT